MRNKATEHQPLSPSFICPRKSFLWRELRQDSQKIPINILVQKGVFRVTSPTSARENFISVDKTNLWFDWTGVLSSGTSSSVHTQVRRVHIKPAKSEEDNRKKESLQVLLPHQGQGETPTGLLYGQINKNCHRSSFPVCIKGGSRRHQSKCVWECETHGQKNEVR